ncbi:MAG: Na+/H+ antiporter NhaC family protein [Spirochaetales bacterium]|nr:Na+/H+ antiporter NhaC family protein [Spirochaetales bacterium]MDY5916045.1 Na+/H+ antiporter NhaC family protein [Treponema sp.]
MEFVLNGTFWALIPAIVAIVLALCTKEVYSSLFIGIIIGGIFFAIDSASGFSGFLNHVFRDCLVGSLSDSYNVGILVFLVILGILVALINKAGGSTAFGNWAKKHIKSKVGAQVCTIILGILIFIDDYFNCLTVGSVMKPVTDKYGVSKEKLAYLIDSTAAPICIIAPISSWAAAVAAFVSGSENGIQLFCKAIPFNFYAIFTIIMMFSMVFMRFEFGSMSKYEKALSIMEEKTENNDNSQINKGRVIDLILPIIVLVVLCVVGMIYSGGFFTKMVEVEENLVPNESYLNLITAFSNSDASVGLVLGSFGTLIITIIFYLIRKVLKFSDILSCVPEGFKAMVPAILILSLAWTLKSMTDSLGAKNYVAGLVEGSAAGLKMFLPAIIFIIACFLAFATGTSWGTFGILIPICIAAFPEGTIRIICISACMAGAVCGDHCSPISDTTIMASAGAQCNHVNHVSTQLPYSISVASISFVSYIVAGLTQNLGTTFSAIISWIVGIILLFGFLIFMKKRVTKKA